MERHRLVGRWLDSNPGIIFGKRVLHFAPEPILAELFKRQSASYQSADLDASHADTVLNIEDIDLPDESVDVIVCSHVLEHVDDAKALAEMWRILTSGGIAVLMFPIVEGWDETYEDPVHTTAEARAKYYGQWDHVRYFGRDVRDRIVKAGFGLSEYTAEEPDVTKYGLSRGERVFIAKK